MDIEIINYLLSRGASVDDIQRLNNQMAGVKPKEDNIFDIEFQKQILFKSAFLSSEQLCVLVREMNRADYVMVERILEEDSDRTYTPEEIVRAFSFEADNREDNINALYVQALQKTLQKEVLSLFKTRLSEKNNGKSLINVNQSQSPNNVG